MKTLSRTMMIVAMIGAGMGSAMAQAPAATESTTTTTTQTPAANQPGKVDTVQTKEHAVKANGVKKVTKHSVTVQH